MRVRPRPSVLTVIAASFVTLAVYLFQHEKLASTERIESHFENAVIPRRNVTGIRHLLIIASEPNVNFCRAILTAYILGYPTPTLLSWNQEFSDSTIAGGSLGGTVAAAEYLRSIGEDKADELALVINDHDVLFQLPPTVLYHRYKSITHDANEALLQRLGPAATTFNLSQDIVLGASKRCTPNAPYSVACYAVPDSPLPLDLYGNNTDTVIGYSTWSSLRQRYLDSGIAIGPVDSMRLAFSQAEMKLAFSDSDNHKLWDDGAGLSEHFRVQSVWNILFGEQQFQREVLRRKFLTKAALEAEQRNLPPSAMEGTIVDDLINPSFTHETMEHASGREYEFGIGLDYWSKLIQQTNNAHADAKFLYLNGSDIWEQIGKPSAFVCPSRVEGRLPEDILRADSDEVRIPSKQISWSDMPWYINLCLDTIPVIIHHNGAEDPQKNLWNELWMKQIFNDSLKKEVLRDPSRTFAVANTQALKWRELCPADMDDAVFGDAEVAQAVKCSADDTFVLGRGAEYIEHKSEGGLWPVQIFKSSSFRPPVVKIEQASNATLAPGLLFITLYNTEEHSITMPGPMIFTDQGRLVWFGPIGNTANFRWQYLDGNPTLLYWMRDGPTVKGHGYGNITLLKNDYSVQTVLCPQYGLNTASFANPHCEADLHEAHIVSNRGTVLTTAYNATPADLTSVNGPSDGWLWDSMFYEIDPITESVLFQWRASDHIPLSESRQTLRDQGSFARPYDFFHINSVVDIGDHYLLSSRHCWTIYLIDKQGNIVWRFSGDGKGDFGNLPSAARFRWQHDARPQNIKHDQIDISVFDNQNWHVRQKEQKKPSKLLVFRLPMKPMQGSSESQVQVIDIVQPQMDYQSVSQGAFDNGLPNGNKLANWGNIPILTEFDSSGKEIWSAKFGRTGEAHIYRGFKQNWHATPYTQPDLFVEQASSGRSYRGYVSWNGATDVEGWNVYAGLSIDSVKHLGTVENKGFETMFVLPCWTRFAQVGAIEQGREVRKSKFFQVI